MLNPKFRFKSWVITISKNLHIDFLRKQNATNKTEFYITERSSNQITMLQSKSSPEDELIKSQTLITF